MQLRVTELRRNKPYPHCTYHPTLKGVPAEEVANLLDTALRANYAISSSPLEFSEARSFHDVVRDVTGADDDLVVQDLVSALMDADYYDQRDGDFPFYGEDQNYELIKPEGWLQSALWNEFRSAITHDRRFFNEDAKSLLAEIFDKVHLQSDSDGKSALYALDSSARIFRARKVRTVVEAEAVKADPRKALGPPPENLRQAGRMNAAGIGAFYGGLNANTCIAELRPPVGSLVCLGAFRPRRPIYVLDFTRFERPGRQIHILSKNYFSRTTQWAFLQSFEVEISKPVLPDDEHLEYVPAQAVAEYLTSVPITLRKKPLRIQGLVFRSAQHAGGKNVVLFGDAALVANGDVPNAPMRAPTQMFDDDIPSLPARAERIPALEFIDGSFALQSVMSATYDVEEEHLSPEGEADF